MIKSKWFRQVHRWVAVAFVLSVVLVSVVLATQEQPAEWIYLSPSSARACGTPCATG